MNEHEGGTPSVPGAPDDGHFAKHLSNLRRVYVRGTPSQRAHIANQRITHLGVTANVLIATVSAAEGVARSLAVHARVENGQKFTAAYKATKLAGPVELITEVAKKMGRAPEEYVEAEPWRLFGWAVKYRNLLVHEATFLNENDGSWLIEGTRNVFNVLERSANEWGRE